MIKERAVSKAAIKEMETRLLAMQKRYRLDPRPELREDYRRLHAEWLAAKAAA